jgi:hypothetical protein
MLQVKSILLQFNQSGPYHAKVDSMLVLLCPHCNKTIQIQYLASFIVLFYCYCFIENARDSTAGNFYNKDGYQKETIQSSKPVPFCKYQNWYNSNITG